MLFEDEVKNQNKSIGVMISLFAAVMSIVLPLLLPWVNYYVEKAEKEFQKTILTTIKFWSFATLLLCVGALIVTILIIGDAESTSESKGRSALTYIGFAQLITCLFFYMFDFPYFNQYQETNLGIGFTISCVSALVLLFGSWLIPRE